MARVEFRKFVFGLAATGLLIGCVEGGGQTGATGSQVSAPATRAAGGAARDIEAPEVYQTTDSALWDGRPSLGGIWVAAPDAVNPERVLIFNPATGKSITGALFKRERENPGPRLQLSSDAAEALGILAGQPTEIRVTALRKEEVKEPEPAAEPAAQPASPDAAAAPAGESGEAAAIATAALAAVDGEGTTAPAAAAAETAKDAAAAATVAAEGAAALAPDGTPKKKTWKERRAEAKAAREAKRRAAAEAKAAAAAAAAGATAVEGEVPAAAPDPAAAAVAAVETAPLDARDPDAVANAKPEKPKRKTVGADPAPVAAAEPAAEAPAATGPARPIQVASFSKEENARRATEALAKIGITASPQKSENGGKAVWGVVVMGDAAMLKKIKDAGFADAYFLK
ncbi:SPOR domain-containing protein [Tabrizicola sp.]|uniref:SPOR domain-containing protein n=1 Tax=Tabrizicola sp. TaxID=2005166 RepID=UPI0035B070C2